MKVILVSHPSRAHHVHKLQSALDVVATVVDTVSAKSGHMNALRIASQLDERVAIMEDDAIPVHDFNKLSDWWSERHPDDLLSFYLGTAYPPRYQKSIDQCIANADKNSEASIWLPTLIHGVCYSLPKLGLLGTLRLMEYQASMHGADLSIGAAWARMVCYPIESLVQHRDETSVERHPDGMPRTEPRVARRLAGNLMYSE